MFLSLRYVLSLVVLISCHGEVIKDKYRLEKMPDGHAVHPKYVLNEHVVDNSNIECASYCSIVLLCSHFVRSDSICWIVSKLVLAQSAQTIRTVTGESWVCSLIEIVYTSTPCRSLPVSLLISCVALITTPFLSKSAKR